VGYSRIRGQRLGELLLLTKTTNLVISEQTAESIRGGRRRAPSWRTTLHKGVPEDPQLLRAKQFLGFLEAQKELLAEAANTLSGNRCYTDDANILEHPHRPK